jgi:hypothetical protein
MKRFSTAQMAEMKRSGADITVVGKHLFGHDWIGEQTDEEIKLIEKYGPRSGKRGGMTIKPCPPELLTKLDRALSRAQRVLPQRGAAADWLLDRGLLSFERCDPIALAAALAKQPPADKVSTVSKVGRPRRIEEIAHRIKLDIDADRLTEQELRAKGNGKNLAHRYGADRATCKKAIEMVLSGAI